MKIQIRYNVLGYTNVIKTYLDKSNIVSVMMQYNMLDRRPEELFSLLEKKGVSVICRGPLAKGLLTDQFQSKLTISSYLNYSNDELTATLIKIKAWSKAIDYSIEELALHFCLATPVVASAICGVSSLEQLKKNIRAGKKHSLTEDRKEEIEKMLKQNVYDQHR